MALNLPQPEPMDIMGTRIPTEARMEAVIISVSQCCCRGCAGAVLTSSATRHLFERLLHFDRPSWLRLRAGVDAALRALPAYEIATPIWAVADARPAPPATTPVQWDL
ncbi:hypothetical protein [Roseomonas chloroacetimidivorans]|uniref:hypothetical protein n=1 Tax=Roseomonas chloroacetimidivorans TaxID=1766656 RepID=UPI003C789B00